MYPAYRPTFPKIKFSLCLLLFLAAAWCAGPAAAQQPEDSPGSDETAPKQGYDSLKRKASDAPFTKDVLKAPTVGQWEWSETTGLRPHKDSDAKDNFWVSPIKIYNSSMNLADYVFKATMKFGKRPDSSLFFRSNFPGDPARVSGYSLTFNHQKVVFQRWEDGYPVAINDLQTLPYLPATAYVYIIFWGGRIYTEIEDASNNRLIHRMELQDFTVSGAQLGYRVHHKQDKGTTLMSLNAAQGKETHSMPYIQRYTNTDHYYPIPTSYLLAPQQKAKKSPVITCKKLRYSNIEGYDIYRCSHEQMVQLISKKALLPEGWFWTEPRNAFTDDEYRQASLDLACDTPMHCDPQRPLDPNRAAKDVDMVQALLDAYVPVCQSKIKHVRLETIGSSYLGYPIRAIVLTNSAPGIPLPRVLFNAAHHGMELFSTDMAFDVLEQLCESEDPQKRLLYDDALNKTEVWIIPAVNPDGNDLFFHASKSHLGRKNGRGVFKTRNFSVEFPKKVGPYNRDAAYYRYHPNAVADGAGVDINRNYPLQWGATGEISSSARPRNYWYRGEFPASEPEIQAMMNLFHTEQFASSISFHTVSTRILSPYSIDALQNPPHDEDNAWQLALKMADAAGKQPSGTPYKVVKNLYSVDGTDQDWFRMVSGTYAYLIEGALHNPTGKKRRDGLAKNRPAWETFLTASKSATVVRVHDTDGRPLIAEVSYSDVPQLNGEHWLTRCEDGTHSIPCFGPRSVTVTIPGGASQTKNVECTDAPTLLDFSFPPQTTPLIEAFCASGYCASLTSIDTFCALRHGVCPSLPASRFCLIDGECVPSGTRKAPDDSESPICNPIENNRGWTK